MWGSAKDYVLDNEVGATDNQLNIGLRRVSPISGHDTKCYGVSVACGAAEESTGSLPLVLSGVI